MVNFTWTLEQPESNNTRNVTLMRSESVNPALFSYHASVTPSASYTFDETRVTVESLLGVTYNVSIVATHLCGQATIIMNTGLLYREYNVQEDSCSV